VQVDEPPANGGKAPVGAGAGAPTDKRGNTPVGAGAPTDRPGAAPTDRPGAAPTDKPGGAAERRDRIGVYRVLRRLATGATSDVLLARAEGPYGFERIVVLKLLLRQFRQDERFEQMFVREASAYARLSHPAIVRLYDFFAERDELVLVLEYVDGLPLNKLRALLRPLGGRLVDNASIYIAWRIFSALAAAHAAKDPLSGEFGPVIHRDINPSNVLIPWDGHVKIADFGMAKVSGIDSETPTGLVKGTYGYVAPEQARGRKVTIRADVYVGCLLLWELLTARKAFVRGTESDLEFLRMIAQPRFASLASLRPDLPRSLVDVVERGLQSDPDRRALQADEVCSVLRSVTDLDDGHGALVATLAALREPSTEEDLAVTTSRPPQVVAAALSASAAVGELSRPPSPLSRPPSPLSLPPLPLLVPPAFVAPKDAPAGLAHELSSWQTQRPAHQVIDVQSSDVGEVKYGSARDEMRTLPDLGTATPGAAWNEPGAKRTAHFSDRPVVLAEPSMTQHSSRRHRLAAGLTFGVAASAAISLLFWPRGPADVETGRNPTVSAAPSASSAVVKQAVSAAVPSGVAKAVPSGPPALAPAPAPAAAAAPVPSETTEATSGTITVPPSRAGHRVWIDDRMVGEAPGTYAVRCGVHSIRVGSQGYLQHVRVPCETDVEVR
jgi:serine/threonine protein kinase